MKTIPAIIERASDGTYSVYCEKEIFSGMGPTVEDAKADMLQQMAFYRETAISEGFKYPQFLDEEYEIVYLLDARSIIDYYVKSGAFTLSSLSKITGIDQKQLWSYTKGTKPRKAQAERICSGLATLSHDLNAIFSV